MKHLYERNRIYISNAEQEKIQAFRLFLAGAGIGSVIAECALRLGFENITIADGDVVEITNLNRQNYIQGNIGKKKAECLKNRLLNINPAANIKVYSQFITETDIVSLLQNHDVAINALDFQSEVPFIFDAICQAKNMPVLHPYNIGWAALILIIMPNGPNLTTVSKEYTHFEKTIVNYIINRLDSTSRSKSWIEKVLNEYENEATLLPPPQLSVASSLLSGACVHLLYKLALRQNVKQFPEFYLLGLDDL